MLMQSITFNEYLKLLLGPGALPVYSGFQAAAGRCFLVTVFLTREPDPNIALSFGSAAFRYGHSTVASAVPNANGSDVPLKEAFFRPAWVRRTADDSRNAVVT